MASNLDHDTDALIRRLRKKLILPDSESVAAVGYGVAEIERLIPHRPPMRLVDGVSAIDLPGRRILGTRSLDASDPIFVGHFPGQPVYPGVLQVEAMGQLALCLAYFITHKTVEIGADAQPAGVRALRIIHAQYFEPLLPGDHLTLHASILDEDGMTATAAGQVVKEGRIASIALQEVYFVE
ncbi:MAG TPA: 3-hydroxyacyl-ACP dehydratase FabZ family protein [Polyangiaceae bacterium]|nr:3-hydroxyacyl-ACP dehydratase FabZ family protein [Polyangiaceae bacterium]